MGVFRLSRRAAADLLEIGAYTLRQWGEDQTLRYLDNLEACCRMLAGNPGLGRACDDIRPGLQRMECGQHVVFYRQESGGIPVSRILHRRMLPERQSPGDQGNEP
ncbi:MAG TPA: type II toxin-antitoxin system RelE/ParE family toxin [Bryobacteraceae bacterium]|nr:type II toxin-antitoxin system RelE/ParE family toxin [Bryobacteraceae bacterium]